ncbi:hypothetical protein CPB83DRAFT_800200 [Crepidotus variabilis]|uniref:pyranose dehydrogenase (acceptor) n=1 Tax=Crepidotus variabilis TaxID=179855 RepID=A0A9P6E573_9AGAR|nr:hypothetical protein CPB83DRAFT_800200 [Crepidotus variabilis]
MARLLHIVGFALSVIASQSLARADHSNFAERDYIPDNQVRSAYDYVIVGGGLAGLVLASRLSEDSNTSVLVLEAGKSGDDVKDRINTPSGAYYQSIAGTEYDWNFRTVPQTNLGNRTISELRGKVLGGSTAMNAMYLVRPSKVEVDAWASLLAGDGGDPTTASRWGWDNLYNYMKKAEQFTPPTSNLAKVVNVTYDASFYGASGPMKVTYPAVMMDIAANWTSSCAAAGMPELKNPNGGVTLGSFITPSSINPSNWTRSYSRSAYIDFLPPRSNLHILSEATVLRFRLNDTKDKTGKLSANGVEYAKNSKSTSKIINVNREVILAAGALSTPKILMHSGVGPKDTLSGAGIGVKMELPGVGQRLQDHMTAPVVWSTPLETAGNIHASNSDFSKSREFNSFINDAVSFGNMSLLLNGGESTFQKQLLNLTDAAVNKLVPSSSAEVKAGYKKIYNLMATTFFDKAPQVELLMSLITPDVVAIQAAIQHPYSIGRVYVNSSNPWDAALIDPNFHSHWADRVLMRQGLRLVRQVGAAYGASLGQELVPGLATQSDADLESHLLYDPVNGAGSQFHPTGTAACLPQALGGVVDADLKVYGLANVRVVDGSIFPFEFAAHLASAGYGVAELASDLIKSKTYSTVSGSEQGTVPHDKTSGAIHLIPMLLPWLSLTYILSITVHFLHI